MDERSDGHAATGGSRPGPAVSGAVRTPNELAALALGKTVAFLLYSVLVLVVLGGAAFLTPLGTLSRPWSDIAIGTLFGGGEGALMWLVVKGRLPGTSGEHVEGFSEWQLGLGCIVLSAVVWVWPDGTTQAKETVQWVVNGVLLVGVGVYFVVKSVLARRPRWGVLAVVVLRPRR